jgi:zinc transport system substrate-binding protein
MHRVIRSAVIAAALLALAGSTACGSDASSAGGGPIDVVAGFYSLEFVSERVGGDDVQVSGLAKPGAEPHDLELNPGQVGQVVQAKLVVYLKDFQPAVDEAIAQNAADRAFDVAQVQPLLDAGASGYEPEGEDGQKAKDPHVWLDPTRLATIGDKVAERLGQVDPDHAGDYAARAKTLRADLEALDGEYAAGLKTCQRREIVTSHTAFGYLANRYQLDQIGISGLTPEDEPSPQRLAAVTTQARAHHTTTIFFETLVSPKVAETIAREVGAKTAVLDPIEGQPDGDGQDYLSAMRSNLATLRTALSCS